MKQLTKRSFLEKFSSKCWFLNNDLCTDLVFVYFFYHLQASIWKYVKTGEK